MNSIMKYFIFLIILLKSIYNETCEMKRHYFFLLPLEKEKNETNLIGLKKYDYMLILKTEPIDIDNEDNLHVVLNVTFPININIDLSHEIIYNFTSLEKFCLNDILKTGNGKYENIVGSLSEYLTENKILQRIYIKIENILFNKEISQNKNEKNFYLLTNYSQYYEQNEIKKKYILMKKMSKELNQNFQIVSATILKEKPSPKPTQKLYLNENNYLCENNPNIKYELLIGRELTPLIGDDKLRDNSEYDVFADSIKYYLIDVHNLVCLTYSLGKYNGKC